MTDRPIIFSGPMVRALFDGRKTQTRRVLKPQPGYMDRPFQMDDGSWHVADSQGCNMSPLNVAYAPGDRLWVKEAWRCLDGLDPLSGSQMAHQCVEEAGYRKPWAPTQYEADGQRVNWYEVDPGFGVVPGRYRHARFMPRWASRLTLTVTDVRVQRLQDISEADAIAEGSWLGRCPCRAMQERETTPIGAAFRQTWCHKHGDSFPTLWNSLHGPDAWDRNDWVAAISFDVHRCNIDMASRSAIAW